MNKNSVIGSRFGRLVVLGLGKNKGTSFYVLCRCDCGTEKEVRVDHLRYQKILSCGCLKHFISQYSGRTHGYRSRFKSSLEKKAYGTWCGIKARCYNRRKKDFSNYGERGITVCDSWHSFENFITDMGLPPSSSHSIERKNNDGNYDPSNCVWATSKEQGRNARGNKLSNKKASEIKLLRKSGVRSKDLCKQYNVCRNTILNAVKGKHWA